jgi:hypothetical protein
MPKPACIKCQRFFRPKTNGYSIVEGMPVTRDALPGTLEPQNWKPYKLWVADLWVCDGCGFELVTDYGAHPVSEHYLPDFASKVIARRAEVQINDC